MRIFKEDNFFAKIDSVYHDAFRRKIAYENANRMVVMFYFYSVFFVLFMILDFLRMDEGKSENWLYVALFVSHILFAYQIVPTWKAFRRRKEIALREIPSIVNLEKSFIRSLLIGLLPMAILGIFERETLVVLGVYSVMINIVMQLGHARCIRYNVLSFIIAIIGVATYFFVYKDVYEPTRAIAFFSEILAIFGIPFYVSRRQYNAKLKEFEYQQILSEQKEIILREKQKSDDLLLNILPKEVAEELKETGHSEAHQFDNVTVIFTDFVNFTQVSEHLTPKELVNEIHTCFKAFDEIIGRYGLEKIKTIGDAYLAVSGLPTSDTKHAHRVVAAALEIRDFVEKHKEDNIDHGKEFLDVRIGIHSGPVIAGIVGVKKFAYDIWGDTVNTAARMEQSSTPGRITVSETTYDLIKQGFICEDRGEINAKHKGKVHMYYVDGFRGDKVIEMIK